MSERHPRWTIAKRDLASLSREKTIVLALIIQLFIAAFSSFLVVGLSSLYDPSSVDAENRVQVAVAGDPPKELLEAASQTGGITLQQYENRGEALSAFDNGAVNAVISTSVVRPKESDGTRIGVNTIVPAESIRTTLIVNKIRELLLELERAERGQRLTHLDFKPVEVPPERDAPPGESSGRYYTFTHTILIPLLLFLPPFISGSVAVDSLTEEIERGTLELLRSAPVSLVDILDGKAVGMIVLAPVQSLLWIALLVFNGITMHHIPWLVVLVAALATITVTLGLLLGITTGNRRQAQLLYSILTLVLFGFTLLLPEHPASTVARLSVNSANPETFATVIGFTVTGIVLYLLTRNYVSRRDLESLT